MALDQEKLKPFRVMRERLGGMLSDASDVINDLNMSSASENLDKLGKKVNNDTFKIQVIGTFKNGKSTFINSLLGEAVLPAYALPCTAVINEVKYGEKKEAILYFRNPLPEKLPNSISQKALAHMQKHNMKEVPPLHIDYSELEDYVVIPMGEDPKEMLLESPYEKVELFWPLEMLKEGVEIIDSPGLEEDDTRTRVTMNYLSKADAILFVLVADRLCSQAEMSFIENNLYEFGFTDPFFIVNRFDLIPDNQKDGIVRFAKNKLSGFSTNDIFFVSAQQALDGEVQGNSVLYEKSQMGVFTERLSEFLTNDKGKIKLSQPSRELKRILNNEALYKVIPSQRAMLDSSLDEVRARYETAKPQLEMLKSKKQQIIAKLQLRIEQSKAEFKRATYRNTVTVAEMIPGWIREYTPERKLGLVPNRKKIAAVVTEISEHINGKIEEQQKIWKNDVMLPLVKERADYIFDSTEQDLTKLYSEIDAIVIQMSGNEDVAPEPVPLWQRIAGAAAGALLLLPDLAIAGGLNGLTKELAKNVAIVIGTEVLLGLFIGFTNPFVLVGGIVAAILGGHFTSDAALKKIKSMLGDAIVAKVSENADEGATKTSETIASILIDIANDISSAVDNEIAQTEQLVTSIIDEMQRGQANIDARKQVINSCETKIKALSTALDAFIFELIEQK
jgi:GTPase SAR1 family protein